MMYGYYHANNFGGFGWIFALLFWGLLIFCVIGIFRHLSRNEKDGRDNKDKTPLDILKERYAKGEIDKKEFEEKKKDILS